MENKTVKKFLRMILYQKRFVLKKSCTFAEIK